MIPRGRAKDFIAQFSGKPGYPLTKEGLKALVDTLEKSARDESHARRIVEDLHLDRNGNSPFAPKPGDITRVAIATDDKPREIGCADCIDGFRSVKRKTETPWGVREDDFSVPCHCRIKAAAA